MLESMQTLLEAFPEAVIQVRNDTVTAVNAAAQRCLPQLSPGSPLPDCLDLPQTAPSASGTFTVGGATYSFSSSRSGLERIILFRPDAQSLLTQRQLEGALRQLRSLLSDVLSEVGPLTGCGGTALPGAAFSRSFHRIFRLLGNLEHLQEAGGDAPAFRSAPVDLDDLCRQTVSAAYDLLKEAGVKLEYESVCSGLVIPGDEGLLQHLLLELIANSARAAGEGRCVLSLRRQGDRALLTLSDSGPLLSQKGLAALLGQGEPEIPLPGQGAGLGLAVSRHIVALHRGTLLVDLGQSASPSVVVSLPTGPLPARAPVRTPTLQRDGGLDPVLVALSDVLPTSLFALEGLD